MDRFSKPELDNLNALIKCMDYRVGIAEVDYSREVVKLNYLRNSGTDDEWLDNDFAEVNCSMENVATAIWEVVNTVFKKCVL